MRELTVVGGGLAGLALVESLVEQGVSADALRVVDAGHPERGSDNPTAIFHPFPGRSLEPTPRRSRLVEATLRRLDRWQTRLEAPPIVETTMVRPLGDDSTADGLLDSWQGAGAYPDWFDGGRVAGRELHRRGEHLAGVDSAFVYRPAYAVDLGALTRRLEARLEGRGLAVERPRRVERAHRADDWWLLECSDGTLRTERLVLALGASLADWFDGLAMRSRGGELLHAPDVSGAALGHIVNAGGHVAPHPRQGVVAGANWWDPRQFDERTDRQATRELLERCRPLYPPLADSDRLEVWRGVRAIFGDHQPLVGPVPGLAGLHVFGAFGSTGLLRIPLHADQFARALAERPSRLPDLSHTSRLNADTWQPCSHRLPTTPTKL